MNKQKIKDRYLNKVKLLNKYNLFYYDKSNPIITDSEYDKIKSEVIFMEENYDFLKSKKSPLQIVVSKLSITLRNLFIDAIHFFLSK